jgi:hypothetical protein
MGHAVAACGVEEGPVTCDDLVVLGMPCRDEHQGRDAGEVECCGVVEVEVALCVGGSATPPRAGASRSSSSASAREASCPLAPVTMIIAVDLLPWFSSVTTVRS